MTKKITRSMVSVNQDSFYNEPYDVIRQVSLNFFDPQKNSNKFYIAEIHKGNSGYRFFCNHGRVGAKGSPKAESFYHVDDAERKLMIKVKEKLSKGYTKVDLATVTSGSTQGKKVLNSDAVKGVTFKNSVKPKSSLPKQVQSLVSHLYAEANQAVSLSLTGSVKTNVQSPLGTMGVAGIQRGRDILDRIHHAIRTDDRYAIERLSVEYYKSIPRKLPSNLKTDRSWMLETGGRILKELDVLKLYEDALRLLPVLGADDIDSRYSALNCDIVHITDPDFLAYISNKVKTSKAPNHNFNLNVKNVYEINMKNAPAFNPSAGNVKKLFHGSRSGNLVGILSSYLKLPNQLSSKIQKTGAMFGSGIYFAHNSTKSANYSFGTFGGRANKHDTAFLMVAEVALGNVYQVDAPKSFAQPPVGYNSVMGVKGHHLLNHEFIVYDPRQVRVRYLIEVEKV